MLGRQVFLAEVLADTWFTWGHEGRLAAVRGGTRPGDNLADMLFSFLFAEVLQRIRSQLSDLGHLFQYPWNAEWHCSLERKSAAVDHLYGPSDVTWMDDLALLFRSRTADGLVNGVQQIATVLLDECVRAVLMPNLGRGKTEAVLTLVGAGSRKAKLKHCNGTEPTLALNSELWPTARLRVVAAYRHLGGIIHHTCATLPEARSRIGSAWAAFRKHQKRVFTSRCASTRDKAILFESLVLSTLSFGIGTWPQVGDELVSRFQTTLVGMSRLLLRPGRSFEETCHMCPGLILAIARVPSAHVVFHVERLRHLALLVRKGPAELWALLHHNRQWLMLAQDSINWMIAQLDHAGYSRPYPQTWTECVPIIRASPGLWKSWLRRAKNTALLGERWDAEVQTYLGLLLRQLQALGATNPLSHTCTGDCGEVCAVCSKTFRGLREWSHHAFKRHGRIRPERRLASGTQCAVCLRHFASNGRLCNHLQHSRSCFNALVCAGVEVVPQPGKGSKTFDSGSDVIVPASQALGPRNLWQGNAVIPERDQPSEGILDGLAACLCTECDTIHCLSHLVDRVREIFSSECLQLSRLRATAQAWHARLHALLEEDEEWAIAWITWHTRTAVFLREVDFTTWLVSENEPICNMPSTFRDAFVALPWLDFGCVGLPALSRADSAFVRVVAKDAHACFPFTVDHVTPHTACRAEPSLLDFSGWATAPVSGGVSLFSTLGLVGSLSVPRPTSSFATIETALQHLRLYGDIIRGTLLLWSKGHPVVLVTPDFGCPGGCAIQALATHKTRSCGTLVLANFPLFDVFPSCFTCPN